MKKLIIFLITLFIVSCGGGGSSSQSNSSLPTPTIYTLTINSDDGGTTPQSSYSVEAGNTISFEISPDDTYVIASAEGCGGQLSEKTFTSPTINANCTISITYRRGYTLPASIENDWLDYQHDLDLIDQQRTETFRLGLNIDKIWFKSLQIPSSAFSSKTRKFDTEQVHGSGIGYGVSLNLADNKQVLFAANWQHSDDWDVNIEDNGNAYAIEIVDGEPARFNSRKIPGSTHPSILKNSDDTYSVIFPGIDEGPLFYVNRGFGQTDRKAGAKSYLFDLDNFNWSLIDEIGTVAAHDAFVYDYDQDGDDDLFTTTYFSAGDYDKGIIFKNNNATFEAVRINARVVSSSLISAFHDKDGNLGVLFGDTIGFGGQFENIKNETNVIGYFDNGITNENTSFKELPEGYLEKEEFNENKNEFEDGMHQSHDVKSYPADIDNDGDIDILISSKSFGTPTTILQILVNHDGVYADETDTRLYNWVIHAKGSHVLRTTDINNDGFIDVVLSDTARYGSESIVGQRTNTGIGSKMLINDGLGNFVVTAFQQIDIPTEAKETGPYIFSKSDEGIMKWFHIYPRCEDGLSGKCLNLDIIDIENDFSTGPNGVDPAKYGVPEFNEFYYILHNPVVKEALNSDEYSSGLDHYLAVGKDMGLKINAK
tara:strand:- start:406 stop:2364 length:1959 start_codon:yes stop_codon:yes gene_type:complete